MSNGVYVEDALLSLQRNPKKRGERVSEEQAGPVIYRRAKLYEEVWAEPVKILAKRYGVSDVARAKAGTPPSQRTLPGLQAGAES